MFVPFVYPWFLSRKEKSSEPLKWYQCQECGKNVPETSYFLRFSVCQKCSGPYIEREEALKNEEFYNKIWQHLVNKHKDCNICKNTKKLGVFNGLSEAVVINCFCEEKWELINIGFERLLNFKSLRNVALSDLELNKGFTTLDGILKRLEDRIIAAECEFKKKYGLNEK